MYPFSESAESTTYFSSSSGTDNGAFGIDSNGLYLHASGTVSHYFDSLIIKILYILESNNAGMKMEVDKSSHVFKKVFAEFDEGAVSFV